MKKFESPQVNVVKFANNDVITTSSGYGGNQNNTKVDGFFNGIGIQPASDPGMDIPF